MIMFISHFILDPETIHANSWFMNLAPFHIANFQVNHMNKEIYLCERLHFL